MDDARAEDDDNTNLWVTREEAAAEFAHEVQRDTGLTVEEFRRRLASGEWDEVIDYPEYRHILLSAVIDGYQTHPVSSGHPGEWSPPDSNRGADNEAAAARGVRDDGPVALADTGRDNEPESGHLWVTREEAAAGFARRVAIATGLSVAEFRERLAAGEWDEVIDDPEYREILSLAITADVDRRAPEAG